MHALRYSPWVMTLLAACAGLAQAQTAPDAGSLLQQLEKDRPPPPPRKVAPSLVAPPPPMKELTGPTVNVTAFRFEGNTLLSDAQLARVVSGFTGRQLDFAELQKAAVAVAESYRQAGWIVRAYLPRQEIANGVVTVQIIEAVFGETRLEGAPAHRVATTRLVRIVEGAQATGALLNANALDRALLLVDDLPGVSATGSLAAGQAANETDLVLKLEDEPLVNGEVVVDNIGSRSTGAWRESGDLFLNSPLHLGDQARVDLIHSQGSDYARLDFSLPVGDQGWRVGANASYLDYRLVTSDTAALDAKGNSSTAGVEADYPIIRSRLANLNLALDFDHKHFDNRAAGVTVSQYKVDAFSTGLSGNLLDQLGGGGSNSAGVALVLGHVDLADSPNAAADAASVRSAGSFTKLRYWASRQQALSEDFAAFASISGQATDRNLDSSEKFYLGGVDGVRAYPANEGSGSAGQLVNLELRARLPASLALTGFFDWGHVTVNQRNDFVGAATLNSYSLKGAGVSLAWAAPLGVTVKGTLARRLGVNPNPTASGNDQDGSLTKSRFWLQASLPF